MAKKRIRWLTNAYDALRRASPAENVRMGYSPKARRYVSANARKVTKSTRSISARQAETRRVRERYGMASPEIATDARKRGALSYVSADQAERVEKAANKRERRRAEHAVRKLEGHDVESRSPDRRKHGRRMRIGEGAARRYDELVNRKLDGEDIPDGEWQWMVDLAARIEDKRYSRLRQRVGSPAAFTITFPGWEAVRRL
jgi:hypothetical protein